MRVSEILNRRRYGRTRINYINEWYGDLNELLALNGLVAEKERLKKVEFSQAMNIVTFLLNRGVAYDEEFMPLKDAAKYTKFLFEDLIADKCECYTNGDWDKYNETNGFGFHNMTESTFDGGVLVTSQYLHFCFWIEEED
ncbi:MAG: hypothetical protein ACI9XO_003658 [Paraglaciecola sp.]|jgi:hypothetical protein